MTRRVYRLLVLLPILVGCQRQLIPTPNLYLDRELDPFANVPSPLKTTTVDLLYATDRQIKSGEEGHMRVLMIYSKQVTSDGLGALEATLPGLRVMR